ncbi:head-tail connector protein [Halomonas dongshanensis]|uniref:Head-tail connector protein n=1 Tax=Halomonas dongshanensis TaxID=2890835 RepID=A0ABT2ECR5_9GAMM|nr:head-tail connector protein [Halomonas dongshanensis]MCS2609372.1 head-tail connector protein [Halomonas dongshanensis]
MSTVTLQEAKDHLRILDDEEDGYIGGLLLAAEGHIADYLGDGLPDPMPAPVRAAVLLLVADLFENRERQSLGGVGGYQQNPTFQLLLTPYRSSEVL